MTGIYVVVMGVLSIGYLVVQLAQDWTAVWILVAPFGLGLAIASLGGPKYQDRRKPNSRTRP